MTLGCPNQIHIKNSYTLSLRKKKVLPSAFLVLQTVTNSIRKDHDWHLGVRLDPKMPIMVLSNTMWSFQVLIRVSICESLKHQKRCLEVLFFDWLTRRITKQNSYLGHSMRNEQIFQKVVAEGSSNFLKKIKLKGV